MNRLDIVSLIGTVLADGIDGCGLQYRTALALAKASVVVEIFDKLPPVECYSLFQSLDVTLTTLSQTAVHQLFKAIDVELKKVSG